jgi:3-oxoadipate enol-lactonase
MLVYLDDLRLNARLEGPASAPPLVFSHALGTDLSIWDGVLALLPEYRCLSYDQRGHGMSDVPPAPYAMGALIRDAERLMDHFAIKDAVFIGCSLGGLVAQGLAVKRLDLVRALVCPTRPLASARQTSGPPAWRKSGPRGWTPMPMAQCNASLGRNGETARTCPICAAS